MNSSQKQKQGVKKHNLQVAKKKPCIRKIKVHPL